MFYNRINPHFRRNHQPTQPHTGGGPPPPSYLEYLQKIGQQITQPYAPSGMGYLVPTNVQTYLRSRESFIELYKRNKEELDRLLIKGVQVDPHTPGITNIHEALQTYQALQAGYLNAENYYKAKIREIEAELAKLGHPVAQYAF